MEGPSLYLAVEQLALFVGKKILNVDGNTRIGKERLLGKTILEIFCWGKHLVLQFDTFAIRVHFMLYGSFEAVVKESKVTGDYPTKNIPPRLELTFRIGKITLFNCSVKYLETACARELYDFSVDVMSPMWDPKKALQAMQHHPEEEVGDVLLDQNIFSGIGNIIKNEILFLAKKKPTTLVKDISLRVLQKLVKLAQEFSFQFYEWRKAFVLKQHYQIYRKTVCPLCEVKVCRTKTGKRKRISFFCLICQK